MFKASYARSCVEAVLELCRTAQCSQLSGSFHCCFFPPLALSRPCIFMLMYVTATFACVSAGAPIHYPFSYFSKPLQLRSNTVLHDQGAWIFNLFSNGPPFDRTRASPATVSFLPLLEQVLLPYPLLLHSATSFTT